MASYSSRNGIKMHAHKFLLTNFLNGTLRFRGFIISDWQGVDRMTYPEHTNYSDSLQKSINAGVDMVMILYNYTEFVDVVTSHVKNNVISMSRIDDAVKRILRVKFTMGLFDNPMADYRLAAHLGSQVSQMSWVGFVIDECLRGKKCPHKDVLRDLKSCLTSEYSLQFAISVLKWEQLPAEKRAYAMREKQEHFSETKD